MRPYAVAVSTHKEQTKAICAAQGVRVPKSELIRAADADVDAAALITDALSDGRLNLPVIVKPCSEDNSQGVVLCHSREEAAAALEAAFDFDDEVLVEEFIALGRELRVGVLEDEHGEPTVVLPAIEYHLSQEDPIRTQHAKFNTDPKTGMPTSFHQCRRSIPAVVDDVLAEKLADAVKRAHKALGCRDYSLYDFRISPEGEPYMLEACLYCSFAPTSVIVFMAGVLSKDDPKMAHDPLFHEFLRRAIARKASPPAADGGSGETQALGMKVKRSTANAAKAKPPAAATAPASKTPSPVFGDDDAKKGVSPSQSALAEAILRQRISTLAAAKKEGYEKAPVGPSSSSSASAAVAAAKLNPLLAAAHVLSAALVAILLLASSAVSLIVVAIAWTLSAAGIYRGGSGSTTVVKLPRDERKTVLVSGAKMSKALFVARALGRRGHRVVMIETPGYACVGARFSRHVAAFHIVPDPRKDYDAYLTALVRICETECVDVFVPVAAPTIAVPETRAAEALHRRCGVESCCYDSLEAAALDDKAVFCQLAASLDLGVPETVRITSVEDARALNRRLRDQKAQRWILKPIEYDPIRRNDLFSLPCDDAKLDVYLAAVAPTVDAPWCGQAFCKGREFNCGAVFVEGKLAAAAVTASCASLQNLSAVRCKPIEEWMVAFGRATGVTGQTQVDFFLDDATGDVKAIEYNPRMGSTLMLVDDDAAVADALTMRSGSNCDNVGASGASSTRTETVTPSKKAPQVYWLFNEFSTLASTAVTNPAKFLFDALPKFARVVARGKDALFDLDDLGPFLACNHLQAPALLLATAAAGSPWRKYDFCIGKVVRQNGD